jgi:hypothetical protein
MSVSRRRLLAASAVAPFAPALARAAESPQALAALGVVYALPLVEMYATRRRAEAVGMGGRFLHSPRLSDATSRAVTTPNVDTLYSSAWIDLAQGPARIALPVSSDYFSLALMDAWSNNVAVLPPATRAADAAITLVGPGGGAGPGRIVHSPTRHVWALGRTFAESNAALDRPHAVQKALRLDPTPPSPPEPPLETAALSPEDPDAFFALANRLMAQEGVLPADGPVLARLKTVGVGPGLVFVDTAETRAGAAAAWARLKAATSSPVGGWTTPPADLGAFGTDYVLRAAVSLTGLAALPLTEAIYLTAAGDGTGAPTTFDGRRDWRLVFAKGEEPPAGAFWSLTLYKRTPEGRQFLVANAADRYAVTSHTPGLQRAADGSLPIAISAQAPSDPILRANWLPAPSGPFSLTLRLYKPSEAARSGRWRPPPVRPA